MTSDAFWCLLGGFVINLLIGCTFTWGTVLPYITGYYRSTHNDVTLSDFYTVTPVMVVVSTIVFPFGMKLSSTIGPRM